MPDWQTSLIMGVIAVAFTRWRGQSDGVVAHAADDGHDGRVVTALGLRGAAAAAACLVRRRG